MADPYQGIYITSDDIKGKAIEDRITRASWTDTDIGKCVDEAENYIEARLVRIGYTRTQLKTAPLVKSLCINYSRYCVLRDIFTNIAPSRSAGEEYEKWKTETDKILEQIENNTQRLVDTNGAILSPIAGDSRFEITSTTKDVKRICTLAPTYEWGVDNSYYDSNVVGKKYGD